VKRPILLVAAATVYALAAWMVAPGFYDGFMPPQYNWTSPPPQDAAGNIAPKSGHLQISVSGGKSDPASAATADGQAKVGFLPGAFDATGNTGVAVDIKPVATFAAPTGVRFATNVYLVTASATLVDAANLALAYSSDVPAPSFIYAATDTTGPWKSIGGAEDTQIYTIHTSIRQLGYFAAGYPANAVSGGGSSQLLPIAVAVLILAVLIAGIPLAAVRRRRAAAGADNPDEADG
jgi:hypothetical protein